MNLFILTNLLILSFCFLQAIFIFYRANNSIQRRWGIFNIAVALWAGGLLWVSLLNEPLDVLIAWRATYLAGLGVTISFYHLAYHFCNLNKRKILLTVNILAVALAFTVISKFFIFEIKNLFGSVLYNIATPAYTFFILTVLFIVLMSFYEIVQFSKRTSGIKRIQALYFIYGFGFGWAGGITTFLPSWGILIYPAWHFTICIYAGIMTYAIFRYRIMDINLAVTRLGIFLFVYVLILGIPFWLGWKMFGIGNWLIPTVISTVLASIGPFIFTYLQRKAEDALLQEEKRVQGVLIKASEGMTSIGSLPQLLKLIVDILVKNLRLKGAGVYLLDRENDSYVLKASLPETDREVLLLEDNPLIHRLKQGKHPVIYEEVHFSQDQPQNNHAKEIMTQMQAISAAIIIPMMLENVLIGFIVLGERTEKSIYSANLMNVLSAVGTQATLAVQDALYLRAETERVEQEGAHARRANLDTMVSTMSHQIFSPLNSIKIDLAFYVDILSEDETINPELKKTLIEGIKNTSDVATHISEIVQSVKDYSRGQIVYENISVEALMKSFAPIKNGINKEHGGADYSEDIEPGLPLIYGDQTMLKEILVIFLNNAHHALKRNADAKVIKLNIHKLNDNAVRFEVVDNGYGIDSDVKKKLFETIYTTKAGGQGLGIGLSRVRRVCELMNAKYGFDSEGEGKGARFWVDVKIAKEK